MAKIEVPLMLTEDQPFSIDQLKILFSYPNIPGSSESLEETIGHWLGQTLERDGYANVGEGSKDVAVKTKGKTTIVVLSGNAAADKNGQLYKERIPGLLQIGWGAYERIQLAVMRDGRWDPTNTNEWRFFLTLGVGIVNFRTLQFFHYPPARLLDPLRDSMHDPVTFRCRDMLEVNLESLQSQLKGTRTKFDPSDYAADKTRMYETRINSSPIAAPDDQGTPPSPYRNGVKPDPLTGSYIPLEYFDDFQRQMIQLYLTPHATTPGYTIPMIVYGRTPRKQIAGQWMGPDCAAVLQMLPRTKRGIGVDGDNPLKTPVLGSNHPYLFYVLAQASAKRNWNVGSGHLVPENIDQCIGIMQDDLAVTYWQVNMARDPAQDPWQVIKEGREYWKHPDQLLNVCSLIWRQASLKYAADDPLGNHFTFGIDTWQQAREAIVASNLTPKQFLQKSATAAAKEALKLT